MADAWIVVRDNEAADVNVAYLNVSSVGPATIEWDRALATEFTGLSVAVIARNATGIPEHWKVERADDPRYPHPMRACG